jgi:predicted RNase H-like HicB family nuclease
MKYEVDIYWSEQDNCFLAEAPDLHGCMADGATYEEALAMIQEVMTIWLADAIGSGEPLPEPRRRALTA